MRTLPNSVKIWLTTHLLHLPTLQAIAQPAATVSPLPAKSKSQRRRQRRRQRVKPQTEGCPL